MVMRCHRTCSPALEKLVKIIPLYNSELPPLQFKNNTYIQYLIPMRDLPKKKKYITFFLETPLSYPTCSSAFQSPSFLPTYRQLEYKNISLNPKMQLFLVSHASLFLVAHK